MPVGQLAAWHLREQQGPNRRWPNTLDGLGCGSFSARLLAGLGPGPPGTMIFNSTGRLDGGKV